MSKFTFILMALFGISQSSDAQDDKYQWLEEVDGTKALQFVTEQNETTIGQLSKHPEFQSIYNKNLEIYNSPEKIASPSLRGKYVYNLWKDKKNERGLWRRSLLLDYTNKKPVWETVLDLDELSKKDNIKWVFKGASGLYPDNNKLLVSLSKGGGDAVVVREFDAEKKQFVENGFMIDESKTDAAFVDENMIIVATNFGEGTLTNAGYPRQVKLWRRGTSLKDAQLLYEGEKTDAGCFGGVVRDGDKSYPAVYRWKTSFTTETHVWHNGKLVKLDIPDDAQFSGLIKNQAIVELKSDWTVDDKSFKSGTLISLDFSELLKGNKRAQLVLVPDEFSSISGVSTTKNHLLINLLTNVTNRLFVYTPANGKWTSQQVKAPEYGTISISATDELTDQYFFIFENFITPSTLYSADAATNTIKQNQSLPAYFDGNKYEVKQYKAKSKDGTMVPYFMVAKKNLELNGTNPTLVYAYGGFEVSSQPFYASTYGTSWLEKGGVFVLANIRGGGEFGPKWHQAGLKEKRQNVFDDLYAVSEDLISKKVTSSKNLGVMGGSNGGLLVGVAFTQRPQLYNAVVCAVPLLDMQRYNKLLAGASWMGEYGNPDIAEEWSYIQKYSPYQNVKAGMKYPEVFFTTSTRDDRVHPGHARKMVAKMNDMGYKTFYYENTEGGHAGSSTNEQKAKVNALTFSYLLMKLRSI